MMKVNKNCLFKFIRTIIVFIIFYFSALFKYIPIFLFKLDVNKINNNYKLLILLSTFASLCLFIILFFIYRKDLLEEFKIFKKDIINNLDTGLAYWIIGLTIMFVSNLILIFVFKSGGANNENSVQEYIKISPIIMSINACLLAPFNEEILFRKSIKDICLNKYVFVFLSFILFGGAHVIGANNSLTDWLYIIPYGALGGVFALAYFKTDTVFTSMFFHFLHNFIMILISFAII